MGQLDTIHSEKRNSRFMCADFAAHGRPLSNRECHWIAPVLLAAVQPGPWFRPAISSLTELDRRARGTGPQDSQDKQTTNEFKDKPTSKRYARGGRKSRWRVCALMGPAAILSHLSWLTTGTAPKHTNKNKKRGQKAPDKQQQEPEKQIKKTTKRLSCGP